MQNSIVNLNISHKIIVQMHYHYCFSMHKIMIIFFEKLKLQLLCCSNNIFTVLENNSNFVEISYNIMYFPINIQFYHNINNCNCY